MKSYFLILYYFRDWPFTRSPKFWAQSIQRIFHAWLHYPYPVYRTLLFAISLHRDQLRKYTNEPYWFHVDDVCKLVMQDTQRIELIIASLLHDTIEDTPDGKTYGRALLQRFLRTIKELDEFSIQEILRIVEELTDVYTTEAYPTLNRAKRKELEAVRKSHISEEAKLVKLCDITNNTSSIQERDPKFFKLYADEILLYIHHFQHLPRYKSVVDKLIMVGVEIPDDSQLG